MATARAQHPAARPLLDLIKQSKVAAELRALLDSMSHREPEPDTSIAWEDGEAEASDTPRPDPAQ